LAVDARGNVFVVDTDNFRVRKITPDGQVSTLIRVWLPWKPAGVAVAGDEVYILEHRFMPLPMVEKWFTTHRVRKLRPDGTVITVATVGGGGGIVIGAMMGAIVLAVWQLRRRRRWHR
jgi:DNA-binding beta-propeller fold protein YncE